MKQFHLLSAFLCIELLLIPVSACEAAAAARYRAAFAGVRWNPVLCQIDTRLRAAGNLRISNVSHSSVAGPVGYLPP